ncbi:hypothetical protein TURU_015214 [Turdus rufiventris]|nr:hypothetical protein TURU_015214 [Turdus rufiventris]
MAKHWFPRQMVESPSYSPGQPALADPGELDYGPDDQKIPSSLSSSAVHTSEEASLSDLSISPVTEMESVEDTLHQSYGMAECDVQVMSKVHGIMAC